MSGYALVYSDGEAFSWHPTKQDAIARNEYERDTFARFLMVVPAANATWKEVQP